MPIRMTKPSEGGSFAITIEDRFDPTDDHVVELMSMETYDGVSKIDGKPYTSLMWHTRIYDTDGVAFLNELDQSPYDLVEWSTLSLAKGKKGPAKARLWAAAFLGKAELTDEECDRIAENFDGTLVGKRARVSWVIETDEQGNKKLKFALLRPMPRATTRAATPETNGNTPVAPAPAPAPVAAAAGATRETPAERRARLQAELAAMEEDEPDGDVPF